jgi:hypothetical protein
MRGQTPGLPAVRSCPAAPVAIGPARNTVKHDNLITVRPSRAIQLGHDDLRLRRDETYHRRERDSGGLSQPISAAERPPSGGDFCWRLKFVARINSR